MLFRSPPPTLRAAGARRARPRKLPLLTLPFHPPAKMAKGKGAKKRSGKSASKAGKISKPGIRRLARRAGVKRIAAPVYDEVRAVLGDFVKGVMQDTVLVIECAKRKTVSAADVLYALKKAGKTLYAVA